EKLVLPPWVQEALDELVRSAKERATGAHPARRQRQPQTQTAAHQPVPVRRTQRNVKRWSSGKKALRWTAAGMLEAERQPQRIIGYRDLATLVVAIGARPRLASPHQRRPPPDRGGRRRPYQPTITQDRHHGFERALLG